GTVLVKHFELDAGEGKAARRLETRLLVVGRDGTGYGATYKWRADRRDADLLADAATEEVAAGKTRLKWYYPGRNDCLACHTTQAGFVLGVSTRQLNRPFTYPDGGTTDNQL